MLVANREPLQGALQSDQVHRIVSAHRPPRVSWPSQPSPFNSLLYLPSLPRCKVKGGAMATPSLPRRWQGLQGEGLGDGLQVLCRRSCVADGLEFSTATRPHAGGELVPADPQHPAQHLAPCRSDLTPGGSFHTTKHYPNPWDVKEKNSGAQSDLEKITEVRVNLTCFFWFDPQNKSAFSANWEESRDKKEGEVRKQPKPR